MSKEANLQNSLSNQKRTEITQEMKTNHVHAFLDEKRLNSNGIHQNNLVELAKLVDSEGNTLLHLLINLCSDLKPLKEINLSPVKSMISMLRDCINLSNNRGETPFMLAVQKDHYDEDTRNIIVDELLKNDPAKRIPVSPSSSRALTNSAENSINKVQQKSPVTKEPGLQTKVNTFPNTGSGSFTPVTPNKYVSIKEKSPSTEVTFTNFQAAFGSKEPCKLFFDGGSRGNPGPAGSGYCIFRGDKILAEGCKYIGNTTNNVAEYQGLVSGLTKALALQLTGIEVRGDSMLVVNQLMGSYKVKAEILKPLYTEAKTLMEKLQVKVVKHVYRNENGNADRLANKAMDDKKDWDAVYIV
jgi:ribonuclease HI